MGKENGQLIDNPRDPRGDVHDDEVGRGGLLEGVRSRRSTRTRKTYAAAPPMGRLAAL